MRQVRRTAGCSKRWEDRAREVPEANQYGQVWGMSSALLLGGVPKQFGGAANAFHDENAWMCFN